MKKGEYQGDKEEDGKLWQSVAKTVKAYAPPKKAALPGAAPQVKKLPEISAKSAPPSAKAEGFDRATENKLKRGQLPLEGRIDLHGMTQKEAHDALVRFIHAAVAAKKRTVLVITGKGIKMEGVLKRMVPLWLESETLAGHILALTPAQPKDGGAGAFYIRLRKDRN